jgi:hypothetical protein
MLSSVEFKSASGAMSQTKKFEGEQPLHVSSAQDAFTGKTAPTPPKPGFSN